MNVPKIKVTCGCGGQFATSMENAGRQLQCPNCNATIQIPDQADRQSGNQPPPYRDSPLSKPSPAPQQSTVTLSDDARASNPGGLRVDLVRWFQYYPTWPLIWFAPVVVGAALGLLLHWSWWILAGVFAAMNYLYWKRVQEHFLHGCAVPGIVISLDPMMLAFSTDMSTGVGTYPAIKIVRQEFSELSGETPTVGTRLVGVALYGTSNSDLPHWEDFDPRPIQTATGDLVEHQRLMATMDEDDFKELLRWLAPVPRRPGLFFIKEDGTAEEYSFKTKRDE